MDNEPQKTSSLIRNMIVIKHKKTSLKMVAYSVALLAFSCSHNPIEERVRKNKDQHQFDYAVCEVNRFAGHACEDWKPQQQTSSYYSFKSIDEKGVVNVCTMKEAFQIYTMVTRKRGSSATLPIFELKNGDGVILLCEGKGLWNTIWVLVEVDRNTRTINKIEFFENDEAPPVDALVKDSVFISQFTNREIVAGESLFGIHTNDSLHRNGRYKVDGFSGSTVSVTGFVDALNDGLKKYEGYFNVE